MKKPSDQGDILHFASLIAHQLQSPISAIGTILKALLGEYAGPLTPKQKDFLARANARCEEGLATVRRMLAIVSAMAGRGKPDGSANLAVVVPKALARYRQEAVQRDIALAWETDIEPAWVRGTEAAFAEVVDALVHNALKYTPDHGRVRVRLAADPAGRAFHLSVADSGIGIPQKEREKVFEPFYRGSSTKRSARPGTGLGLSFVKAIVEEAGGTARADKADLGGAEITLVLPMAEPVPQAQTGDRKMPKALKVVIIGGVAAGPKVASKVIRMMPDADVAVVEKDQFLSYVGCGLPYYICGLVRNQSQLMCTPAGMVRDAVFFQQMRNLHVMSHTEALDVDRVAKRVRIRDLDSGQESYLDYDKLVLATGSTPVMLHVPGAELGNIFGLHGMRDAEGIKAILSQGKARDVVVVGGGLLGMVMAEPLSYAGCRVTIVEKLPQTLPVLDWEMARLVELHLESKGVKVLTGTRVVSFGGNGKVRSVMTDKGSLPADLVIMGIGVRPNVALAERAHLALGETGAIKVDPHMRTSDPDIYAAGDCVECTDIVTGRACYVPLGSTANKQGRIAAVNLCGGSDTFPGVLASHVCQVFEYCVARTGLTEAEARRSGYEVLSALAPAPDREHYLPTSKMLLLKLVVDRASHRLLGAQSVGPGVGDKRIDIAAMAITAGMTVHQLANVDLCYAPPYSSAMDNIITAANVARNKLAGHLVGVPAAEVHQMLEQRRDFLFLDVRSVGEYERERLGGSTLIPLCTLRGRLDELPRDKEIVAFSEISLRGYEAALVLRAAGFGNVRVLDGGVAMWPYERIQ
jgi:NADPH-dependent 2,4-dienoyl-CoA reductase/sulfur reductase-like enzyme/rhodanese-related sulfurtransferase/two-component sensor histidine kinase